MFWSTLLDKSSINRLNAQKKGPTIHRETLFVILCDINPMGDSPCQLTRHQAHNLVDVDQQADVFEGRANCHDAGQVGHISIQPIHVCRGQAFADALVQLFDIRSFSQSHNIAGANHDSWLVDRDTVQLEVTVNNTLSGLWASRRKAGSSNHVVQPTFANDQQQFSGIPRGPSSHLEVSFQLTVTKTVIEFDLLLFRKADSVNGRLLPAFVHAGRKFLAIQSLDGSV